MKKMLISFMSVLFLVSCNISPESFTRTKTIIDWIDFVKINNEQYYALYTVIIADPKYIGAEIGKVHFKVDENITNPNYIVKNGDAAFWEKGTLIYEVKGMPNLIAIADKYEINGYRIYQMEEDKESYEFQNLNKMAIQKIEVYDVLEQAPFYELSRTLLENKDIEELLILLETSEEKVNFVYSGEDPSMFELVFYSDIPIAYYYRIFFDGEDWYWHPLEEEVLPNGMENYLH